MNLAKQRGVAPREVWFRVLEMSAESRALLWRERGQWDRPVETEQSVLRPPQLGQRLSKATLVRTISYRNLLFDFKHGAEFTPIPVVRKNSISSKISPCNIVTSISTRRSEIGRAHV